MKPEDVIKWEARRVLAALGVQEWGATELPRRTVYEGIGRDGEAIYYDVGSDPVFWQLVIGEGDDWAELYMSVNITGPSLLLANAAHKTILARALYCLDIQDSDILDEIDYPLSMHERMMCHEQMPREFWPQKWLDEEIK